MKFKIVYIGIILLLLSTFSLSAQDIIKGRVLSSADKSPVAQAQISSEASASAVITDEQGNFSIELTNRYTTLRIQRAGFYAQNIYVGNRQELVVYLIPTGVPGFNETVDLPLGSILETEKIGTSITLNKKDLDLTPNTPDQALHGRMAGLQVLTKSGMPGEGAYVNLRGTRSLATTNTPLIVVDGMPYLPDLYESSVINGYSRNIFMPINLKDVENVSLIKGVDAAQYGSLSSNGVMLINTEKATDLETKVEFHTVEGIGWMKKRIPMMDAVNFKTYIGDVGETATSDMDALVDRFPFLKDDPSYHYNYVYDNDTKWQDEIYTRAITSENILKIKGGDAIANYALSVGYLYNKGVVENTNLSKYFTRLNANITVSPKVELFVTAGFNYSTSDLMEQGLAYSTNPLLTALHKSPLFSVYERDQNGNRIDRYSRINYGSVDPTTDAIGISNPKAVVSDLEANAEAYDILVNAGLNYKPLNNLTFNALFGIYYNYDRQNIFIPGKTSQAIAPLLDGLAQNTVRSGINEGYNLYFHGNGTYSETFNDVHNFNGTLGYQMIMVNRESDYGTGINTSSDFYKTLGSATDLIRFGGYTELWNWMNIYARASYNYKHQFYATLGLTADAASSTGENSQLFAILPSARLAWKMNNSPFLQNVSFINDLTLRAEYSQLANSRFPNYYSAYTYGSKYFREVTGTVRMNLPNSKLQSERLNVYNIGLDFATLGQKLNFSVDLYREETRKMLNQKDLGGVYGFGYVYDNAGRVRTEGVDFALQAQVLDLGGFQWYLGGNISKFKSEIRDLGGVNEKFIEFGDGATLINRVGESPYSFYGYKTEKVFSSQTEADAANLVSHTGERFNAGDIKFVDMDNNKMIDSRDREILGSATPDFFGGFYSAMFYKGFSLDVHFTYSYGNKIYNAVRRSVESMSGYENQSRIAERRWTFDGQATDIPRANYGDPMGNSRFSDRWIEDGSFLKLRTITLGYEFSRGLGFIRHAQIYVTGENLFTATKYLGLDPEFSYSYDTQMQGMDLGKMPLNRAVKLGIKFNF